MNILILGGTQFVGRAISDEALQRGHRLTLFHRGRTNPGLFPQATHILGDRDGELDKLGAARWDAVIDVSGYLPRLVRAAAEALQERVQRYVFISTISVYEDTGQVGRDEEAALIELDDPTTEEIRGETYGGLKVLCERAVEDVLPGRALHIRPGLIVGPHDHTNRFTYWPVRIRKGGEVLAPGKPDYPVQFVDARDLAQWTLDMTEQQRTGTYNVTGPAERLTMGEWLRRTVAVTKSDATLTWVEDEFLLKQGVQPFQDLPFWVPRPDVDSLMSIDVQKAVQAGLRFRPLEETVRDLLAWVDTLPGDELPGRKVGISLEREAQLLAAYRDQ